MIDLQGQSRFAPSAELAEYIHGRGSSGADVHVKFGKVSQAGGMIKIVSRDGKRFDTVGRTAIAIDHELLAGPLAKIDPRLRIRITDGEISGWAAPAAALDALHAIEPLIAHAAPALGLGGFDLSSLHLQNAIEGGVFKLGTPQPALVPLAGWITMTLDLGLENDAVRLLARGDVNVRGLGQGKLEISRKAGKVAGSAEMVVQLARFSGKVTATYEGGAFAITGTLSYATEKLRGEVTVVVMEAAEAERAAQAQIDPQLLAAEPGADGEAGGKPAPPRRGERGVAGWGELDFALTEWFTGKAKVVVGPSGHVTIVGKIAPPKSVELLAERTFHARLFSANLVARYGVPYVADIHAGLGVELGAAARIGPATLSDIAIEGVYSTDPKVRNQLSISGALRIAAYAGLNLRLEGKAGLSIVGHDIELGAAVIGAAGVKGYAEARPTLGYREKEAGKPGECFLKGHLELAAQPVLGLGGELFVRLDSPAWSPAPDKTWTWPLSSLEYPVPGEFGISADIDYVIGSKQWPQIQWGKAQFDASKFTESLLDRHIPDKKGGGEVAKPGTWKGEGAAKGAGGPGPTAGTAPAKAATGGQRPEHARNVPKTPDAAKRWLAGMQALGELHQRAEKHPETEAEIRAHLAAIQQRFGFTRLAPHLAGGYWIIEAALNPQTPGTPGSPGQAGASPTAKAAPGAAGSLAAGGATPAGGAADPLQAFRAAVQGGQAANIAAQWQKLPGADRSKVRKEPDTLFHMMQGWGPPAMRALDPLGVPIKDPRMVKHILAQPAVALWRAKMSANQWTDLLEAEPKQGTLDQKSLAGLAQIMKITRSKSEAERIFHKAYPRLQNDQRLGETPWKLVLLAEWTPERIARLFDILTKKLPAPHVRTATGGFLLVSKIRVRKTTNQSWDPVLHPWQPLGYAYFRSDKNLIVLPSIAAGAEGGGVVPGVVGGQRTWALLFKKKLTYFQAGALHEVGHAVGHNLGGHAWAERSGPARWQVPDIIEISQLWEPASQRAPRGGKKALPEVDAKSALMGLVVNHRLPPLPGWSEADLKDALAAQYGKQALFKLADSIRHGDNAYRHPVLHGGFAYTFTTRLPWLNQIVKYTQETYRNKVSEYSLSSAHEWFAEQYVHYYHSGKTGKGLHPETAAYLKELEARSVASDGTDPAAPGAAGPGAQPPGAGGAAASARPQPGAALPTDAERGAAAGGEPAQLSARFPWSWG